ncbi:MAG TPA: hypothetical protein DCF45_10315 [Gammaproteobacteria bacterium]|nr:hypothetical protein [Gammaproteobacteria bacterium]
MAYQDLGQYVASLARTGELLEIDVEVDPVEELGAICRKVLDENGPAILFNDVKGYDYPVLANMLATPERIAQAFEVPVDSLTEEYTKRTTGADLQSQPMVDTGPCKEVTISSDQLDIKKLIPQILSNPDDGGAYLNYGLVIMKDPDTGRRNMGIYRMQIRDNNRTGLWSSPTSHGGTIRVKGDIANKPTELAVCIGADPLLYVASQIPGLDLGVDEIELAAAMRGEPYEMVKCDTVDLEVPAHCQMVLEGHILPNLKEAEGPYGEYPGYYGPVGEQPVIEFHHATHRKDPLYAYTYLGLPPTETHAMGQMMGEAGYLQRLRASTAPTVKDVYCPLDMHTIIVSLKKTYEEQAKHVIYDLWSTRSGKTVIVVDDDIDPRNSELVYWAIAQRCHASRDVMVVDGMCTIGPSTQKYPGSDIANKMGIDATAPLQGYPAMSRPTSEMMERVEKRWGELTTPKGTRLRASAR